jgi:hypothetical protein
MLKGTQPLPINWIMLAAIALVTYLLVQVIFGRQLQHLKT